MVKIVLGLSPGVLAFTQRKMVDGEDMEKTDPSAVVEAQSAGRRALRHELNIPLRYRLEGQQDWSSGEAINMSESGLLFTSDQLLEIDARVQITFQKIDTPQVQSSTRLARVVRRTLSNWPETQVKFGARFCS
ncbi:MAG TPA: PilZ domain-containing protein [Candidatus Angelobacter sp.]|nr:PilZ domain-containing protein [Candidatus Angelobacter sp.]